MKLLHTADWHWEVDKLDKIIPAANFIVRTAGSIKPHVHALAGDYWNRWQSLTDRSAVIPARRIMVELANISPVIGVKGNNEHDQPGSYSIFENLDTKYPVYFTERPETVALIGSFALTERLRFETITDDNKGLLGGAIAVFHLFPYPTKAYFLANRPAGTIDVDNAAIREAIRAIFMGFAVRSAEAACPVILIAHANITGSQLSNGQSLLGQEIMVSKDDLELACADYVALGHIHMRQQVGRNAWYAGSVYNANFGETEEKQMNLVTIDGDNVTVEGIPIPSVPLAKHDCEFDGDANSISHLTDLEGVNAAWDWQNAHLRVRVHLTKDQRRIVTDENVHQKYPGAASYQIEYITIPTERVREAGIKTAIMLRDKLRIWAEANGVKAPERLLVRADEIERSAQAA